MAITLELGCQEFIKKKKETGYRLERSVQNQMQYSTFRSQNQGIHSTADAVSFVVSCYSFHFQWHSIK